jgi:hypothetical protein
LAKLPLEFLNKNELPAHESLDAIEVAITRVLTSALRTAVSVRINDQQLDITAYPMSGAPIKINMDSINRKLRRHIFYQVELELQLRNTLIEAKRLKELRGNIAQGEVYKVTDIGTLLISLEIADFYRRLILIGECPYRFQPRHERHRYCIGDIKQFYITSILPVMINKRLTKVRILLSRTSKEIPKLLLQERACISGIRCMKRIPGSYSKIVTQKYIPKDVINTVGKELGEHLHVSIFKTHH